MNLQDLHLFVAVVEHGGFAAASRALDVPKSTLSKRVAALEDALGARLLFRTSRSVSLTDVGRDYFDHARAAIIEAQAAEEAVRRRVGQPVGTVRVTAAVSVAQRVLAPYMPQLARAYPQLCVHLHATDRFVDIVQEGYDIAVRSHLRPLPDSALVQRRVRVDAILLVAARSYVLEHGTPKQPQDLARHHALLTGPADVPWGLEGPGGATAKVTPLPRIVADEVSVLREATLAGLGVACLPEDFCRDALDDGRLVHLLPGWTAGRITTTLLMPDRRSVLPGVRAVVEYLCEHLADRTGQRVP